MAVIEHLNGNADYAQATDGHNGDTRCPKLFVWNRQKNKNIYCPFGTDLPLYSRRHFSWRRVVTAPLDGVPKSGRARSRQHVSVLILKSTLGRYGRTADAPRRNAGARVGDGNHATRSCPRRQPTLTVEPVKSVTDARRRTRVLVDRRPLANVDTRDFDF